MIAVALVVAWFAVVGLVLIARADYGRRPVNDRKQHRPGVANSGPVQFRPAKEGRRAVARRAKADRPDVV